MLSRRVQLAQLGGTDFAFENCLYEKILREKINYVLWKVVVCWCVEYVGRSMVKWLGVIA